MSDPAAVALALKDNIAEITINRPDRLNALDYDVLRALEGHLRRIQESVTDDRENSPYRAVVLRGAGKAFVAGADIKVMHNCSWEEVAQFIRLGQRVFRNIESLPLPVIAIIDGFALGGGLELALSCDLIIATDRATLGQPETKLGVIPGFGGTQRLALRVGVGRARRMIYTGESVSAERAYQMGLVDWLVPHADLEKKVSDVLNTITSRGPLALAAAKRSIEKGVEASKLAGLTFELDEFLEVFDTADAREGLAAFVEKRSPQFRGEK